MARPGPALGDLLARAVSASPFRPADPLVADALLAGLLAALALGGLFVVPSQAGFRDPDTLAAALALCQTLPLALRRRAPGAVLVPVWLATAGHLAGNYPPSTVPVVGAIVATYSVAAYGNRTARAAGAAAAGAAVATLAAVALLLDADVKPVDLAATSLVFLTAWVLGDRARTRRAYTAALEDRARQLEWEREARAEAAVRDERTRIARELHDVVAHHVSVMVVQAAGARRVLRADPPAVREALGFIEETGRQALGELRTLLGALRREDGETPDLMPQPGLAELPELLQHARDAGLPVELRREGGCGELPPSIDLSAYRIVQEALTNVLKHADEGTAVVLVRCRNGTLSVEITDDGRARPDHSTERGGQGLVGMRERVMLFGGDFSAEPQPSGGFRVAATFPLDAARR